MVCRRKSLSRAANIEYINFAFCLKRIAIGQIQVVVKSAKICGISFMAERTIKKFDLQRGYIAKKFKKKKNTIAAMTMFFNFFFVRANSLKRKARGVEMGSGVGRNVWLECSYHRSKGSSAYSFQPFSGIKKITTSFLVTQSKRR